MVVALGRVSLLVTRHVLETLGDNVLPIQHCMAMDYERTVIFKRSRTIRVGVKGPIETVVLVHRLPEKVMVKAIR